jgi:hypothetical protein
MHETAAAHFFGSAEAVAFGVEDGEDAECVAFDAALPDAFVAGFVE